jgi:hypothetical protein
VAESSPQERLLNLYKIAVEEYRFEVRLGWDRATYFLVLNSAILSVATGLLKLDSPPIVYIFISLLFGFGLGTSLIGSLSITKAHEYYRWTVVKKTVIEERLGLSRPLPEMHPSLNLSIATTRGQRERMDILRDPGAWVARPHGHRAITFWLRWILRGMAVVDGFGVVIAAIMCWQKWSLVSPIAPHHLWKLLL